MARRSILALALVVLLAGCGSGYRTVTMTSCPMQIGPPPSAPLAEATVAKGGLTVRVRDYGLQPGPGCFGALIGITVLHAQDSPEGAMLTFHGKSRRSYPVGLAPVVVGQEYYMSLTVPEGERMMSVTLKKGLRRDTQSLVSR